MDTAQLQEAQLDDLHVAMRFVCKPSGLHNTAVITEFVGDDKRQGQTHCMVELFALGMSAEFCSTYVSSILVKWIEDGLSELTGLGRVRTERLAPIV